MKKIIISLIPILVLLSAHFEAKAKDVEATIIVENATAGFTIDTMQNKAFLEDDINRRVLVVDLSNNSVITTITPGHLPFVLISANSNNGLVYVKKSTPYGLLILDGINNTDPFKDILFAGSPGNSSDSPGSINDLESDPDSTNTFASGSLNGNGQFWIVEGESLKDTLTVGSDIDQIAVCSPSKVIVSEKSNNQIHLIDIGGSSAMLNQSRAIVDKVNLTDLLNSGKNVSAPIACNSKRAYLAGAHDTVIVINTETLDVIKTLAIDNLAKEFEEGVVNDITVNPVTNKIYIGHRGAATNKVLVIDGASNKLDEETDLGNDVEISEIRVNPTTNKFYVLDNIHNTLKVIPGSSNASQEEDTNDSNSSATSPLTELKEAVKDLKETKKEISILEGPTENILNPLNVLIGDTKKIIKKAAKQCKRKITKKIETQAIIIGIDTVLDAVDKSTCRPPQEGTNSGNKDDIECFQTAVVTGFLPGLEDIGDRIKLYAAAGDLCK